MPPVGVPLQNTTAARTLDLFGYGFQRKSPGEKKAIIADAAASRKPVVEYKAIEENEAFQFTFRAVCGSSTPLEFPAPAPAPAPALAPAAASPLPPPPRRPLEKPLSKGLRFAEFRDDRYEWEGKYHEKIGTSTQYITLGSSFVLTEYVPYLISNQSSLFKAPG